MHYAAFGEAAEVMYRALIQLATENGAARLSDGTRWQVAQHDHFIIGEWAWPTQIRIHGARMLNLRDGGSVGVTRSDAR